MKLFESGDSLETQGPAQGPSKQDLIKGHVSVCHRLFAKIAFLFYCFAGGHPVLFKK